MRLLFSILFLVFTNHLIGQNQLVAKYKRTDSTVLLRWAVSDVKLFKENLKEGFIIRKLPVNSIDNVGQLNWENAELFHIFPYSETDTFWVNNPIREERTILIQSILYGNENYSLMAEQNAYSLSLVACDQNKNLAQSAGLFFEDKNISTGKNYAYQIKMKGKNIISSPLLVNQQREVYPSISDFNLVKHNKSVDISWRHSGLMQQYSSFQMERSTDSIHFFPLLKQKFVPISSQYEKEKSISVWNDTSVQFHQKYYYKIVAYDYFGDRVKETTIKAIHVYPPLQTEIRIDTIYEEEANIVNINWSHLADSTILEFHIYHANSFNGEYQLKATTKEQRISIPISGYSNYFKVTAISKYGDSISSWPELFILPDRIAPHSVSNLEGRIDSLGQVVLSWKKNEESDIKGYRVFRANTQKEEFIEVSRKFIFENTFYDSIYLENLTREIYYYVIAVDMNYNNSLVMDTLKLIKPDIIAPVAAQFKSIKSDKNGILLEWVNSSSIDLSTTTLMYSWDNSNYQIRAEFKNTFPVTSFLDSTIDFGRGVYYQLKVEDDAGNYSLSKSIYAESQKIIPANFKCEAKVNRQEKFIQLNWSSPNEKVFSYTIYKAKQGEKMRSYKTLGSDQISYMDRNLYLSNHYIYTIKATLESGREVLLIENMVVEY